MPTAKTTRRTLALAALSALFLVPYAADSGTCTTDTAARDLLAASRMEGFMNSSGGEDLDFLYRDAGFPNVMFLFDSSKQMRLLPPAGPANYRDPDLSKPLALPPGAVLPSTSATDQTTALNSASRVVGCGLASDTNQAAIQASGMYKAAAARRFHSPCGNTTVEGASYSASIDYAQEMAVCPYYTANDNVASGDPGFDPDYYNKSNRPHYFGTDLVYHDVANVASTLDYQASAFGHNFGDGWTDTAVYPFTTSNNAGSTGTVAQFCAKQGTPAQVSACTSCLNTNGWYYDGILLTDASGARYPSIWYAGRYLSFFPPKFLIARKVVKDLVAQQPRVRLAVSRLDAASGSVMELDFKPNCTANDQASWDQARTSTINTLKDSSKVPFSMDTTPLSRGLLEVGHNYLSWNLTWWGASRNPSTYNEQQAAICAVCQSSNVIVLTGGVPSAGDGSTVSVLPAGGTTTAQATSGIYAGDSATGVLGITSPSCPHPWCDTYSGAEDYLNNLPRAAWYLQNMDFRFNTETPADCAPMGGVQRIQTFTVGFATSQSPKAATVLKNAADAGGGMYVAAEDASTLKEKLQTILQEISTRSTSFSVATLSTLQTTSGRAVIVPRFDPNKTAHWKGHLFRFDLYSEFVNTCTPGGAGDLDCDGKCTSTFLQDQPGTPLAPLSDATVSLISEDATGAFVRNEPATKALCAQSPSCTTAGSCSTPGNAAAVPFWDAGGTLAARNWQTRKVFTVVDDNHDGKIDLNDTTFELMDPGTGTVSTAAVDKLVPYLAMGRGSTGISVCDELATKLTAAGDSASASRVAPPASATTAQIAAARTECAKTIIRYVLGADILNERAKTAAEGWPPANEDLLWDRDFKLGDIFHSSPQVVDPPLPREGILCPAGLSVQCIPSLWETPTHNGPAAYDGYASSTSPYYNRSKFILVGANDGLLHAFHAGRWIANTTGVHSDTADDSYTSAVDESLPPFNGHFDRGTAEELWAFLPPDMISKLPALMGSTHQFFVDGTAMVRDVWVDGSSNGLHTATSINDIKEAQEFHTVAVVGERRGGNRFFALDVTNADAVTYDVPILGSPTLEKMPKFLWIYPQPNDPESLTFGETYDDFLPAPPPIGPVRVATDGGTDIHTDTLSVPVPTSATQVPYHEKWVAFLNGGFDPQYVRGRGVHMVDVWNGVEIFDFSYPTSTSTVAADDPRRNLRFPVPGVVGMTGWGLDAIRRESAPTHDFFFDTATFSDAGGQLWTLRFFAPGERSFDSTTGTHGKVTNWFGGRAFQMGITSSTCNMCTGQPIFVITGDASISPPGVLDRVYRTFFGTGDRFNLLDLRGGTCGPDNIRACVQRGCSVEIAAPDNYVATTGAGVATRGSNQAACGTATYSQTDGAQAGCTVAGKAKIVISGCPNASPSGTTKEMGGTCVEDANGDYNCSGSFVTAGAKVIPTTNPITLGNWFFSILVFEKNIGTTATPHDRDIFWDLDGAKRYDGARTWVNQTGMGSHTETSGLVVKSATDTSTTGWANQLSKGWAIYYNHDGAQTISPDTFTVDWRDERTSAGAAFGPSGIVTWRTTQNPISVSSTTTYSGSSCRKCSTDAKRIAFHYNANALSGAPVFFDTLANGTTTPYRSRMTYLQVPGQADQRTVFINAQGQVAVGLTSVSPETGASNVGMSDPVDPTQDAGFIEVDRETHACRHATGAAGDLPACNQ
jgi:type IV pilus assembly protein PilY1